MNLLVQELLDGEKRYILYLKDMPPKLMRKIPYIQKLLKMSIKLEKIVKEKLPKNYLNFLMHLVRIGL